MAEPARVARATASEAPAGMSAAGDPAVAASAEGPGQGAPRPRLTREKVLAAALEFVDANGLAALSMHKLGAGLGVQGMSLYSHVASKDALLDGIVEAMTREAQMPPAGETDWRDALRHLAGEIRGIILRHPAAAPLLVSRRVMPTRRLEQVDAYIRLLMRAGFTEDRAMDVLRTVYMYAHGYALAEACFTACAESGPWPADELSQMRRVTEMVPRDAPDHLLRLAMQFCGRCNLDDQFTLGIDLMIRGLDCNDGEPG
ncbi:MAG: TetR/AcrR family transcriptional regulator C-terminal domain-containing protein [Streptosporangiaceae bacterium]